MILSGNSYDYFELMNKLMNSHDIKSNVLSVSDIDFSELSLYNNNSEKLKNLEVEIILNRR